MSKGKKEKSLLDLITAENIQEVNSDKKGLEESIKRFNEVTEFLFATDEVQKVLKEKDKKISDLEAKLAESEKKREYLFSSNCDYISQIEELKQQLAEWTDGTIICKWTDAENKVKDLEHQLAEKEKELHYKTAECEKWKTDYVNCSNLEKIMSKEHQYCLDNWRASEQDKISFALERLERLKPKYLEIIDNKYFSFSTRDILRSVVSDIDNQIKQLKEKDNG